MSLLANYFFLNSHLHCSRLKDNGRILRWEGGIGMTTNISRHPGLLHSRVDVIQEFVLAKSFIIWLKHWKRNQEGLKSPAFFLWCRSIVSNWRPSSASHFNIAKTSWPFQSLVSYGCCWTGAGAALCHYLHVHKPDGNGCNWTRTAPWCLKMKSYQGDWKN